MPTLPVSPSTTSLSVSIVKSSPAAADNAILNTPPVSTVNALEANKDVPPKSREVPVATPISGVTRVGEVLTTNVVPVPVCAAIDVAFPTEVIGPVRLALVVTVSALPVTLPVKAPTNVSEVIEVVPASVIAPSPKVNLLVAPPMVRLSVDVVIEVAASTVIASLNWSKSRESSAIWPPVITPEPFMISVPATTKALSQPLPMLRALSAASVPVSAPTSTAFKVTSASPVRASMAMRLAVFVPAVALPISASMFNRLWMFVPAESAGVVEANSTDDDVPESALLA